MSKTLAAPDFVTYLALRILAGGVALAFAAVAVRVWGWIPVSPAAATVAIICCWFALRGHVPESRARIGLTLIAGIIPSAVGFFGGLIGVAIVKPNSPQWGLMAVFLTGPLGFVLGALGGWIYAGVRRSPPKA